MSDLTDDLTNFARDAFYVGVGAGVIGFQKAQVKRVELTEAVKVQADEARAQFAGLGPAVEGVLADVKEFLDSALASLDTDEVVSDVKAGLEGLGSTFDERLKDLEARIDLVEDRFESLVDEVEGWLPEQARDLVKQFRGAAKEARDQVRSAVRAA